MRVFKRLGHGIPLKLAYLFTEGVKENCDLQHVRWRSMLEGSREAICSSIELEKRISESLLLLQHIFQKPALEALKIIISHGDTAQWLLDNTPILAQGNYTAPCHTTNKTIP